MPRCIRTAISYLFAILISLSGTVMLPGSVLCVGPGNHCHFETVVGASCDGSLSAPIPASPRPRDGCPKGSRDLRLGVDTQRGNKSSVIQSLAPGLAAPTGSGEPLKVLQRRSALPRSLRAQPSRISTTVLRC